MVVSILNEGGTPLPALYYTTSFVISVNGTSQTFIVPSYTSSITITTLTDCWVCIGNSSVVANGQNGCDIIPAGTKWCEGIRPGQYIAISSIAGDSNHAVFRWSDG